MTALNDLTKPLQLLQATDTLKHAELVARLAAPDAPTAPPGDDGDALAAEAWAAALRKGISIADRTIGSLQGKLSTAKTIQLVAAILTSLGGGTLIGLIAGDSAESAKIAVASVTFLASVLTLIANFFGQTISGASRATVLADLLKASGEATGLALYLEIWAKAPPPRTPIDPAVITRVQALVAQLTTANGQL